MTVLVFRRGLLLLVAAGIAICRAGGAEGLVDLRPVAEPGKEYVLRVPAGVEVFSDREARLSLGRLQAGHPLVILAMDRFALQVQGRNQAGPVTGWIGRRQAVAGDAARIAALERFHARLRLVEGLIAERKPGVGMSSRELERALGNPDTRRLETVDGRQVEVLEWISQEDIPVLTGFPGLAKTEALLTVTRETGRRRAVLDRGVVISFEVADGTPAGKIEVVPPPGELPFEVRPRVDKAK